MVLLNEVDRPESCRSVGVLAMQNDWVKKVYFVCPVVFYNSKLDI